MCVRVPCTCIAYNPGFTGHQCSAATGHHCPPPALGWGGRLDHSVLAAAGPAKADARGPRLCSAGWHGEAHL